MSAKKNRQRHLIHGVPMAQLARETGISYRVMIMRRRRGWPDDRILLPQREWNRKAGDGTDA